MIDFTLLPTRLVSLRDLRWGDNGIDKDALAEPYLRREIDDEPIYVEQLITGQHFFVHDGRHRVIRALMRGEHEIEAYALTNSLRRELDEAQAQPQDCVQTEGEDCALFPLRWLRKATSIPSNRDLRHVVDGR